MQIHRYEKKAKSKLQRLEENPNLSRENKEILRKFYNSLVAEGLSFGRIDRYLDFIINYVIPNIKGNLSKFTDDELLEIAKTIRENQKLSEHTKYTYINMLRKFAKWLNQEFNLELNTERIKAKQPRNNILPESLITEDEFWKIYNGTEDKQMKVIVGLLFETGCRIGEILSLKIQNVAFNHYGARIKVSGKTGERILPVIWFAKILREFIEAHPFRDVPEAPLFIYRTKEGEIRNLTYDIFRNHLVSLLRKVGIKKRIHPHLFRHTALTRWAKKLPEATLKHLAGWSMSSKMAQIYVHMSQRDVEKQLLNAYGVEVEEREEERIKICVRCGEANPYFAKFCMKCGLDFGIAYEEMIAKEIVTNILDEVVKDRRAIELFKEFMRQVVEVLGKKKVREIILRQGRAKHRGLV